MDQAAESRRRRGRQQTQGRVVKNWVQVCSQAVQACLAIITVARESRVMNNTEKARRSEVQKIPDVVRRCENGY
jgi:hypothetical protein